MNPKQAKKAGKKEFLIRMCKKTEKRRQKPAIAANIITKSFGV
jgi:hypothetical protein